MNQNYFTSIASIKMLEFFCFLLVSFLISISSYGQDVKNHLKIAPGIGSLEIPAEVGMSCNSITE
ncbi:MAG: hypothetical protein ABI554_03485 [Flavobacterium sp.]